MFWARSCFGGKGPRKRSPILSTCGFLGIDSGLARISPGLRTARGEVYIHRLLSESAMKHLLNWALSALAVWIVARVVPGFHVSGPLAALIAALVIGFVNATLGVFLKIITFPLVLLTLGLFWLVINAAMIELASAVVPGFHVDTFGSAFVGAIVLALVNMFFRWLAGTGSNRG